ncbi:MAG TPA: exonuclease domain-containing protein [bacterium]|nr:exonuclease domain-containing protein [bacterium]
MEELVKNMPVVVALDIETTGLNSEEDRIVEIALLKMKDGRISGRFSSLINPEIEIPASGLPVNNIKPSILKDAPLFRNAARDIHQFIKNEVLLIQNADFDIPFLKAEFRRCGMKFPETTVYDTLHIAKTLFSFGKGENSLSSLARAYRLEVKGMHRAEKDAMLAYEIFCRFMKEKPVDVFNRTRETSEINYVNTSMILKTIEDAIDQGREICIKYKNRNYELTTRHIEPVRVFNENGKMYLDAFCSLKNAGRKFRLDKILEVIDNI